MTSQFIAAGNLSAFSSCSEENGGSLTTKIRKPSEDVAAEQKPTPTPIKPGVWRNKWLVKNPVCFVKIGGLVIDEGEYISQRKWPSREIAEEKASEYKRKSLIANGGPDKGWLKHAVYIGPVFFPEEGGGK